MKNQNVADTFIEYFGPLVESLDLRNWKRKINDLGLQNSNQDYLDIYIRIYEKHPSMQVIKQKFRIPKKFSFQLVSKEEVKKKVKNL